MEVFTKDIVYILLVKIHHKFSLLAGVTRVVFLVFGVLL